jgi:hypothetical protein
MPEGNGTGRLDRVERLLESLALAFDRMREEHDRMREEHDRTREEHDRDYKQLMTAQVLMQDNLRLLTERMEDNLRVQRESQKYFDERVDKLVSAIGEFIRTRNNRSA